MEPLSRASNDLEPLAAVAGSRNLPRDGFHFDNDPFAAGSRRRQLDLRWSISPLQFARPRCAPEPDSRVVLRAPSPRDRDATEAYREAALAAPANVEL